MITHTTQLRVLYGHTDQMGVVYYGRYFEFFEAGRNELLRELDLPYYRMENSGLMLPVIESHANYKGSFKYDDWVMIKTMLKELPTAKIKIDYELSKEDGDVLVTGHTIHVFVNAITRKPTKIPVEIYRKFEEKF